MSISVRERLRTMSVSHTSPHLEIGPLLLVIYHRAESCAGAVKHRAMDVPVRRVPVRKSIDLSYSVNTKRVLMPSKTVAKPVAPALVACAARPMLLVPRRRVMDVRVRSQPRRMRRSCGWALWSVWWPTGTLGCSVGGLGHSD